MTDQSVESYRKHMYDEHNGFGESDDLAGLAESHSLEHQNHQTNHAHDEEQDMTETDTVTPEDVAATALDEADEQPYTITPAADPDEEDGPEPEPNAETMFLVVIGIDGSAFATSEVSKITEVLPKREATIVDMRRACLEVVHDVMAQQTAMQTVGLMQQQAQAMAEQARGQKIAAKLQQKGIHVPGR